MLLLWARGTHESSSLSPLLGLLHQRPEVLPARQPHPVPGQVLKASFTHPQTVPGLDHSSLFPRPPALGAIWLFPTDPAPLQPVVTEVTMCQAQPGCLSEPSENPSYGSSLLLFPCLLHQGRTRNSTLLLLPTIFTHLTVRSWGALPVHIAAGKLMPRANQVPSAEAPKGAPLSIHLLPSHSTPNPVMVPGH